MELIYLHHSGFALLDNNLTVVIDYFEDSISETEGILHEKLLNREGKMYVLASHFHADHFNKQIFDWKKTKDNITYILSYDIFKRRKTDKDIAIWLKKGDTFEDENIKIKAFGSTDVGISFAIEIGGKSIFHAGDLNNWHWMSESSEKEWKKDENRFLGELQSIKNEYKEFCLTLFPIDPRLGNEYMRGGIQFVEAIKTHVFIPMHFWGDFVAANKFQEYARIHGITSPDINVRGQIFSNII